jgi:hypothetical protein
MSRPKRRLGPRIIFKAGDTGARLFAGHLEDPAVCRMIAVIARTAPPTVGGVVVITEAWREGAGLHPELKAVDVRTGIDRPDIPGAIRAPSLHPHLPAARELRLKMGHEWAEDIALRLGSDFDVVFGDPAHIHHIHVEHDL